MRSSHAGVSFGAAARAAFAALAVLGSAAALATRTYAQGRQAVAVPAVQSELRDTVELFSSDRAGLLRRYALEYSPARRERMRRFYTDWQARLRAIPFERLGAEGRVDHVLLDLRLRRELDLLALEERRWNEMASWVPFAAAIFDLEESRRRLESPDGERAARAMAVVAAAADSLRRDVTRIERTRQNRIVAMRAAQLVDNLRRTLTAWQRYYAGYDPVTSWWVADPYRRADQALERYARALRETVVGYREGEEEPIVGDPIGADALRAELAYELIPYTPEEIVAIAEREFAWCEAELRRAARDMGLGEDWRAALERVKNTYVEPGAQPALIRDLAREAEEFIARRDLVTVPPLAREIWRMEMMTPEQQRVAPFFLGGEIIRVSYPTDGMSHEEKLMSMRGNNPHFSRATVHHELIPGHHLQGFMNDRYNSHRNAFSTPFWTEGWALYWEMLLWDLGFPRTPEDRIGMLFWRSHRAARIIFSLRVHMGTMTPEEAIDFLVNRVGHERANAIAEVRRSFNGTYPPLYQAAYMLGGLQFRALQRELVGSGRMTNRQFHDAILQGGRMPVELVRARLVGERVARDYAARWRF